MKEHRTAVCAADAVAFTAAGTCTAGTAASAAATATTASAEAPATATTYYRGFGVQCVHRSPQQQHSHIPLILKLRTFAMHDLRTENLSAEEEDLAFLIFSLVLWCRRSQTWKSVNFRVFKAKPTVIGVAYSLRA